jgi:hypothetical protein
VFADEHLLVGAVDSPESSTTSTSTPSVDLDQGSQQQSRPSCLFRKLRPLVPDLSQEAWPVEAAKGGVVVE